MSPASGVARDFTNPVTYTVTAADGTTQDYTVTVIVAALAIGDTYGGGIVAYIDGTGVHGLIAAAADQTPAADDGIQWATEPYLSTSVPGALATAIGTGAANTDAIIAQNGAGTTYAAGLARAYTGGGYSDWFLPSKDELNQLYLNRVAIGGFTTSSGDGPCYWSSSQYGDDADGAWNQTFDDGCQYVALSTPRTSRASTSTPWGRPQAQRHRRAEQDGVSGDLPGLDGFEVLKPEVRLRVDLKIVPMKKQAELAAVIEGKVLHNQRRHPQAQSPPSSSAPVVQTVYRRSADGCPDPVDLWYLDCCEALTCDVCWAHSSGPSVEEGRR